MSENFDKTLTHENYPFAQIAADYDLSADIMFAYQMGVISQYSCLGGELEVEDMELNIPKFGLAFFVKDWNGIPCISLEYDNGRYSQGLMQSLVNAVKNAITAFIAHPDSPLRSISLLDKEQKALLESFNHTEVSYDDTQTVVSMFRRQASLTPDAVALVYHDVVLNYRQVDEQSERIASYIHSLGLEGEEDLVGEGISFCAVCDGDFYKGKTVCMAGGGNSALQEAILLAGKCEKVIMLQDLPYFTGESRLQDVLFAHDNVEKHVDMKITGIKTEGGKICAVTAIDNATGIEADYACDGFFEAIGLIPENDDFKGFADLNQFGYFDSKEDCVTKTPGLFVAGDCRSKFIRQVATACGDGAVAALAACRYVDLLAK